MLSAARFGGRALSRDDSSKIQDFALFGSSLAHDLFSSTAFSVAARPASLDVSSSNVSDAWLSAKLASESAVTPVGPDPVYNGGSAGSTTMAKTGDQRIDGILSGTKWNTLSLTYADTDSSADYQSGYNSDGNGNGTSAQFEGFSRLSAQELIAVHFSLNDAIYTQPGGAAGFSVEGFTGMSLTYSAADGAANIRIANSSDPATSYAYYPNAGIYAGDAWIGTSARTPTAGNYAWYTMMHELGHTLGLKHGQETNGYGALPSDWDSHEFSIMTYRSYIGSDISSVHWETWGAPQTFMMLDIAALQAMYGADYTTNSGNTTYTWSPTTGQTFVNGVAAINPGGNRIFMTVWDGGGIDTYDLSNYSSNLEINLNAGSYSDFNSGQSSYLGGGPNGGYARGNVFNALLYQGNTASLIENANGGSGSDSIVGNEANNTLVGNGGNDSLYGNGGTNALYGGAGNDYLAGGSGTDYLYGGADNDIITGGGGANDQMYGEGGDDIIYWGPPSPSASRIVDGGDGVDWIYGGGTSFGVVTFDLGAGTYGFSGYSETWRNFENYYNYGSGSEIVIGTTGANTIITGSGANVLDGGAGEDTLYGGAGNDTIYGGFGTDTVYGQDGDDTFIIRGDASSTEFGDNTDGGAGIDTLDLSRVQQYAVIINLVTGKWSYSPAYGPEWTITAVENVTGTANGDTITGDGNTNIIHGMGGNDIINGGGGSADQLYGDDGDDRIFWAPSPAAARTVNGGNGVDTIDGGGANFVSGVTFNLGAGTYVYSGSGFSETWANFENYFNNGTGVETVIGTVGANIITTGSGNNSLQGGDGNDILDGGLGDDTLDGGNNIDIASYATATAGVTVSAQVTTAQATGGAGTDVLIGIEGLIGSAFDDTLTGTGAFGGYVLGGAGNDYIYASVGADNLDGGTGIDTVDLSLWSGAYVIDLTTGLTNYGSESMINFENVTSGAGDDNLIGTAGANTLNGGSGNDVLEGGLGNDRLIGGAGFDTADYHAASAAIVVDLTIVDAQNTRSAGNDRLSSIEAVIGSAFNDRITGDTANNTISGGAGIDNLLGGDGADYLLGGDDNDRLVGGGGNDVLLGGLGKDTLTGNGGRDTFTFDLADSGGTAVDTIMDFQQALDKINLTSISTALGSTLDFIGSDPFSGVAGELRFRVADGDTRVMVDFDGDKVADFTVKVTGEVFFVQSDFVL